MPRRPPTFTSFLRKLGVFPTPGQEPLTRVAFDSEEPSDVGGPTVAKLFGGVERVPSLARSVVVLVKGRGIGGTYLSALRMLHLMLTLPLPSLATGEIAYAVGVAPDKATARQLVRFARGALTNAPALERLITAESTDGVTMRRRDGKLVALEVFAATRGGSSFRGRTIVAMTITEAAFCRDENYSVNAGDLFQAARPRLVPGGQIILESTPWTEAGLFWELYRDNFRAPEIALVAHAPTELMRDDEESRAMVAAERARDEDNFRREHGGEFMGGGAGEFFDGDTVKACHDLPRLDPTGAFVAAGADFGFRSDGSALAIVRRVDRRLEIVEWEHLLPNKGEPLAAKAVVQHFAAICARYGINRVMADSFGTDELREALIEHKLRIDDAPNGAGAKAESYSAVRTAMRDGRVRIPSEAHKLVAQLRSIVARPTSGGGLSITAPRRAGAGHADLASAFILAVHAAEQGGGPDWKTIRAVNARLSDSSAASRYRGMRRGFG